MLRRATIALVAALACTAAVPISAQARRVLVPPGNSGASQYVEVVPSAGGGTPSSAGASGNGPVLSKATRQQLAALGPAGKAVAAFAQSTGVPRAGSQAPGGHGPRATGRSDGQSGSGLATASSSTEAASVGGLGIGLPIALIAILVSGLTVLLFRRRRLGG